MPTPQHHRGYRLRQLRRRQRLRLRRRSDFRLRLHAQLADEHGRRRIHPDHRRRSQIRRRRFQWLDTIRFSHLAM
jgi:hypothetical protein